MCWLGWVEEQYLRRHAQPWQHWLGVQAEATSAGSTPSFLTLWNTLLFHCCIFFFYSFQWETGLLPNHVNDFPFTYKGHSPRPHYDLLDFYWIKTQMSCSVFVTTSLPARVRSLVSEAANSNLDWIDSRWNFKPWSLFKHFVCAAVGW